MLKIIIQARSGSSRLPAKILMPLAGRPVLERVVTRCAAICGIDNVVVATTTNAGDDVAASLAVRLGASVFRGSEEDVLDRYYQAASKFKADPVVRVTADCPLLDVEVSKEVIRRFNTVPMCAYASNCLPPLTFPNGLDIEVFRYEALRAAWREAKLPSEREHVTPYLRNNPARFHQLAVSGLNDHSAYRWTLDYEADYKFLAAVFSRLSQTEDGVFSMGQVLDLLDREPALVEINRDFIRNEKYHAQVAAESQT